MNWLIAVVLLILSVILWWQLQQWKKWSETYRAWVSRNCSCQQPGGDPEPVQPTWP